MTSSVPGEGESASVDPAPVASTGGRAGRGRRRRRLLERWFGPRSASVVEWLAVIVGAVGLALVVKVFLLQAFYIPSLSMYPTLHEGDRVLVNKLSYKLHDVNRGDIIVFERPASEASSNIPDLIKRVIGLPGDKVSFDNGSVYINGERLNEPYLPDGTVTTGASAPNKCLPVDPCVVPSGMVWVMGDNRGDSKDSRYFGAIPESSVVGRALITGWPFGRFGLL